VLSLIIPTFNEAKNIGALVGQIVRTLGEEAFEIVVVDDDSPDGTGKVVEQLPAGLHARVVRRHARRDLSQAVVEGFAAARGGILGVMDADLSHPPELIPTMLAVLRAGGADMVVASRLVPGGGTEDWPASRKLTSRIGTLLARPFTRVRDPLSGYFLLKREVIEGVRLKPRGYKICLEILVRGNARRVREIPFIFRDRTTGESKIGMRQDLDYLVQLLGLAWFRIHERIAGRR
jgi:dolichol-phosphate mannosyltransferase